jgi:hypothetical protein
VPGRSAPSFDSALKDFIAPNTGINIQNCAQVIIKKETDPDEAVNTTDFSFTKNFNTDPTSPNTFTLKDDGVKDFGKTVLFGGTAANPLHSYRECADGRISAQGRRLLGEQPG